MFFGSVACGEVNFKRRSFRDRVEFTCFDGSLSEFFSGHKLQVKVTVKAPQRLAPLPNSPRARARKVAQLAFIVSVRDVR
jgi:hypothetical protein